VQRAVLIKCYSND